MAVWKEALLGAAAAVSLLPFLRDDWSRPLGMLFLFLCSLLYGGVLAALVFTSYGWVATLIAVVGAVGYFVLRRRRPQYETLSARRRAEAEALMEQVRRGQ